MSHKDKANQTSFQPGNPAGNRRNHSCLQLTRERIRAGNLINRLQKHIRDPEKYPMKKSQLESAMYLINKVVPDAKDPADAFNFNMPMTFVFDDPTRRPDGYDRKPNIQTNGHDPTSE